MSKFYMKLGKLRIEESEKEKALNFGLEGEQGKGFFSLPLTARGMARAAGALGVTLATYRLKKKLKKVERTAKDAERRGREALKNLDFKKLGGGKR
ncbi:MAG: hypothetical protein E7425_12850 [Ruminococcaceae bacterium]|nr:hypothetical protein [Oscillospiraceae bacterium]